MGLFDNVFGGHAPNKQLSKSEAFAAIMLGSVACDGYVSDEEGQGLITILSRMKLYENWSADKFNAMMNRLSGLLKREGVDALVDRGSDALPENLRETAFANACDLVLADGIVEDAEKEFLDKLQKRLELTGDTALDIVHVMIIKNRG